MKKIIKKLRKLNNSGSSIVMVIAALAFLAIIVGSLLTAAGYAYKLKLSDLNSRDNFYYVEQAMNEIYAGVGSDSLDSIRKAYVYTVENMTYYDPEKSAYVTRTPEYCQEMFNDKFIEFMTTGTVYAAGTDSTTLGNHLSKYISNDTVVLDSSALRIQPVYTTTTPAKIDKIIIKNIKLNRTQDYNKSVANGAYTQTISTDIEVGRPDFEVLFNAASSDKSNLYDYAIVADMGIEICQPATQLTINGNVYAANDYYNKLYNYNMYADTPNPDKQTVLSYSDSSYDSYKHVPVSSKDKSALLNYYEQTVNGVTKTFDGENPRSMYSGIYVSHSDVSIIGDMIVVPGTIAVMDKSSLSVYSRNGKSANDAEVWADNLILGGFSSKSVQEGKNVYLGSKALIRGNIYMRDDTEINSAGSEFRLKGGYYGYGNSTERDGRQYVSTVDINNFTILDENNNRTNRGHYNSSAIIVNGNQAKINFFEATKIFLAGRSYIELSSKFDQKDDLEFEAKHYDYTSDSATKMVLGEENGTSFDTETGVGQTLTYLPREEITKADGTKETIFIRDYKMGESVSFMSNQKAYIPITSGTTPKKAAVDDPQLGEYYEAELTDDHLKGSDFFETYFPKAVFDNKIPCICQTVSGKKYYYYHFAKAYKDIAAKSSQLPADSLAVQMMNRCHSPEEYAADFISAYASEIKDPNSLISKYLVDISVDDEMELGEIKLPNSRVSDIYSSGAITVKEGNTFSINTTSTSALSSLFNSDAYAPYAASNTVLTYSNALSKEYEYVKWNLGHYSAAEAAEKGYVDALVSDGDFGDASITPINKFLDFSKITSSIEYHPASGTTTSGANVMNVTPDVSVWVDYNNVTISDNDGDGKVTGVVVTKGDVIFDNTVEEFCGLIVSGGKVYINQKLKTLQASPQTCTSLLRNCLLASPESNEKAKFMLDLFKVKYDATSGPTSSTARTIDTIDYKDVVSISNWMKNIEE